MLVLTRDCGSIYKNERSVGYFRKGAKVEVLDHLKGGAVEVRVCGTSAHVGRDDVILQRGDVSARGVMSYEIFRSCVDTDGES